MLQFNHPKFVTVGHWLELSAWTSSKIVCTK